ncbi:hypothetical protein ES702_05037 [subsurface metagenome]
MIPQAERKKTALTEELWKDHPAFAKSLFAIRLLSIMFPGRISKRLQKLIGDAGIFNPDLQPPGWIYDPNEFPPPVDYTSYGTYGELPSWITDLLSEEDFNYLSDTGQLASWFNNTFGPDEISYFNEYGAMPSWLMDIWGPGPIKRGVDPPPAADDYWFYEPWDTIDESKWTKTVYAHGNLDTFAGYLVMSSTDSGLAFTLVQNFTQDVPSALDVYIKYRSVSGTQAVSIELYSGVILMNSIFYGTSSPSGLKDYYKSTVNLWAKYDQNDIWKIEIRTTGWKYYLNDVLIAENTSYWTDSSQKRIYIEGRHASLSALIDYIVAYDVS